MMALTKMTVTDFIDLLGSDAPAPGGGSAAALYGAAGAALLSMVAALTTGKSKYEAFEPLTQEILAKSDALKAKMIAGIDRDTIAFDGVSAVFKMPKDTDAEKEARKKAMQAALKEATIVPFALLQDTLAALELVSRTVGHSNPNAASDLGVAAVSLKAAAQGAWLNVLINLGGIKDDDFVAQYKKDGAAVLRKVEKLADEVYKDILAAL